jgi:uncharacterized membrane protein YecN with MAPEG domain
MAIPTVTALYGALNAFLNVGLAMRVSLLRIRQRVSMGTGESKELMVAVRTHANNAEFVPLAIVMMLLVELSGGSSTFLHVVGGLLFVARVSHAIGMPRKAPNVFRVSGNTITWTAIAVSAVYLLVLRKG